MSVDPIAMHLRGELLRLVDSDHVVGLIEELVRYAYALGRQPDDYLPTSAGAHVELQENPLGLAVMCSAVDFFAAPLAVRVSPTALRIHQRQLVGGRFRN